MFSYFIILHSSVLTHALKDSESILNTLDEKEYMVEKGADPGKRLSELGFSEEVAEEYNAASFGAYVKTGFPKPLRRYRLVYESQQASLEHTYFWVYNHLLQDQGFSDIIKVIDTFSSSENSSFWGMTEQRKSIQQDKASNFLAIIGKMVKELFQIVNEIRILKERLKLYKGSAEGKHSSDVALKGYWVDFVDGNSRGGAQGGMNIYGMASQLGFATLPDLFYKIYVKDDGDVDEAIAKEASEFNDKVKEVLKRKLALYMAWRTETEREFKVRERFTLRYLRQHWAVIKMYSAWVRPYLRNVQKLTSPDKYDKNPELISSFEGALMEIEILAKKAAPPKGVHPVVLTTFNYRVSPQMAFRAEGGNQGAVHVGRIEVSCRAYGWTQEDIDKYLQYREEETMELLELVDSSVKDAMDALGKDLREYLKESGETANLGEDPDEKKEAEEKAKKEKEKHHSANILEPFSALYGGFKDMVTIPFGSDFFTFKEKASTPRGWANDSSTSSARITAAKTSFAVIKFYKKAHGMPSW